MAISAYTSQGKLKKNPLLGTSLAVDPGRAEMRQDFMSLHGEARENVSEGREGMLGTLAERFKEFGGPEVERLDVIKRRMDQVQSEANDLRLENIGSAQDKIDALTRFQEIGRQSSWGLPQTGAATDDAMYREFYEEWRHQPGSGTGAVGGGKTTLKPGVYAEETWLPSRMETAQSEYDAAYDVAAEDYYGKLGVLGQQHEALTSEQKQREGKLAKRAGLYNMFLGA